MPKVQVLQVLFRILFKLLRHPGKHVNIVSFLLFPASYLTYVHLLLSKYYFVVPAGIFKR